MLEHFDAIADSSMKNCFVGSPKKMSVIIAALL